MDNIDNQVYLISYLEDEGSPHEDDEGYISNGEAVLYELDRLDSELPKETPIQLNISCEGGTTAIAAAIQSMICRIRRGGRKVHGHVMGVAMSCGFDILQVCDNRSMESFAALMTHQVNGRGNKDGADDQTVVEAEFNRAMDKIQFEVVSKRTGVPVSFFQRKVKAGTNWYILAPEAKRLGLVDQILQIPEFNKTPAQLPKKRITKKKKLDDNHQEPT